MPGSALFKATPSRREPPRSQLLAAAAVGLGGAVGTCARALVAAAASGDGSWPWATFVVNIIGAFLLGIALVVLPRRMSARQRHVMGAGLRAGLLGGLTTYSTFIMETVALVRDGRAEIAIAYAATSVCLGVAAAAAGSGLATLARRTPATDETRSP